MNKMSDPDQFQGRIIFKSMVNDIMWRTEDNEQGCFAIATFVSVFAKRFFSRTLVILRTWIRNEVVFHLQRKDHKENGTESLN